ncbi:hypothetical protein CN581_29855 [Bacillus toyonensis]|uniref:hypothetical protein n=1 Tax=Bacillus toyonensis TaxID=155322 RepID=UPI000BF42998|nr:hypothetical protein [Bacillus toyonensis]PEP73417.1 hypothetical protein CN581_29855 [Bacillus toyonensis]PHF44679.1 hypothetical protein COI39_14390 [Bacillus toyonensis]
MNIWAKLSLICVPYALLTVLNEETLEIGGSANIFWKIGLFTPLIGIFLSLGASSTSQRILLVLLNTSYYLVWIYLIYTAPMFPPDKYTPR